MRIQFKKRYLGKWRRNKEKKIKENHDRQVHRALRMYEFGYSTTEIAMALGINESNIRNLLQEEEKAV
jgi:DNA-directed RNA polymerase specialized sigma24 family protein